MIRVRESLQALFDTNRVADVRVEASDVAGAVGEDDRPRVALRFVIRPQVLVAGVEFEVGVTEGTGISEDELRARLNLLDPGKRITAQSLKENADAVQVYLRDRGFYRADVKYEQRLDATRTRATVIFRVTPGPPTQLEAFNIDIEGFDAAPLRPDFRLKPGATFTQEALGQDIARVRAAIIAQGRLAPRLAEPDVRFDPAANRISVSLKGSIGPKVEVLVAGYDIGEKRERELLPVRREGTIEPSAIEEGRRRLRNRLQEQGYFFAEVNAVCTVNPPLAPPPETAPLPGGLDEFGTCDMLNPDELGSRDVKITYEVERGRRFKLTDIRIDGTERLAFEDARKTSAARGHRPRHHPPLATGRGYTSEEALRRDTSTLSAERDLATAARASRPAGRHVEARISSSPSPSRRALTRVAGIEMRGNQSSPPTTARPALPARPSADEACLIEGGAYSRTRAATTATHPLLRAQRLSRRDRRSRCRHLRARQAVRRAGRLIYTVKESDKVFINNIFVNGIVRTERQAILDAIPLREGEVLRGDELAESERALLNNTDAFRQVIIRTEPAGETPGGFKRRDVIIDVEESKRLTTDYIVGFSTDNGPLGGFEVRNVNLFGKLREGAFRSRFSRLHQLVRFEYFDPRFRRYGARSFAPLTASLQYQRDTSVTRFFRSTIDRGSGGIVQRFDAEGKLIDEFGQSVKEPSINRLTFNLETRRDFELELSPSGAVRKRSTLVLRYNYEDVRLFNIGSLLIAPALRPDQVVRLSRFGASFARDTRDQQFDPTRGDLLRVDYGLALKGLGGNISFSKFLANYSRYKRVHFVRDTVLAASFQLGLARLYNPPTATTTA